MKIKVRIEHRYAERNGVSASGNAWRAADIKFAILNEDWSESRQSIVVSCNDPVYLDSPQMQQGAIGTLSFISYVSENNGRCYNRLNVTGWEPQQMQVPNANGQMQTVYPGQGPMSPEVAAAQGYLHANQVAQANGAQYQPQQPYTQQGYAPQCPTVKNPF